MPVRCRTGYSLQAVSDGPSRTVEADVSAVLHEAPVGSNKETAELSGDMVGIGVRLNVDILFGGAERAAEAGDPVVALLDHGIPDPARLAVELRHRGLEETASWKYLALEVGQERVAHRPDPADPGRCFHAGLQDLFGEDAARLLDDRELQLLLGAEVGQEAAPADPPGGRQAPNRT